MNSNYRVRYRKGDIEIEIESSEKEYVDNKLEKLMSFHFPFANSNTKEPVKSKSPKVVPQSKNASGKREEIVDIIEVANAITSSEEFKTIEEKILKATNPLAKILLVFYFAKDKGNEYISTSDVEKITNQLNVRIHKTNVSNTIKKNIGYFTPKNTRRRGVKVLYKLNLKGIERFEDLVKEKK